MERCWRAASARAARYGFFAEQLAGGGTLILGHHREDQVETVLLRLLQGRGMYALGFDPIPANFADPTTIAQLQETYLFWRIAKGAPGLPDASTPWSSAMPAWENFLTQEEIWDVIIFLYEYTDQEPRAQTLVH